MFGLANRNSLQKSKGSLLPVYSKLLKIQNSFGEATGSPTPITTSYFELDNFFVTYDDEITTSTSYAIEEYFDGSSVGDFTSGPGSSIDNPALEVLRAEANYPDGPTYTNSLLLDPGKIYTINFDVTTMSERIDYITCNVYIESVLNINYVITNTSPISPLVLNVPHGCAPANVTIEFISTVNMSGGSPPPTVYFDIDNFRVTYSKNVYTYAYHPPVCNNAMDKAYRYGFQAQEKDDELWGEGNGVSYKYRIHDTRLGRFLSVDPLSAEYPWNSSYAFSENRLFDCVELEGLEAVSVNLQKADDVTFNVYVKNTPTANPASTTTNIIDYNVNAAGVSTPVTPAPLPNRFTPRLRPFPFMTPDAINAINGTTPVIQNTINNTIIPRTPVNPIGVGGNINNQFNNSGIISPVGGTVPGGAPSNFSNNITNFINQTPGTPEAASRLIPQNITKLLIVTNGSVASNANALTLIGNPANPATGAPATGLMALHPTVQFSVISDPLSGINNDQVRIVGNPTANFIAPGAGIVNPGAATILPFTNSNNTSTPILPAAPVPPAQPNIIQVP